MNNFYYVSVWSHANLDYQGYVIEGNKISTDATKLRIFKSINEAVEAVEEVKKAYEAHLDVLVFGLKNL